MNYKLKYKQMNKLIEEKLRYNGVFKSSIAPFNEELQDAMRDFATEMAVNFLEWTLVNGWRKLDGLWEFSDGDSHRTTKELYILFESELAEKV